MAANSLLAGATQILCFIARVGDSTTSAAIAKSLKTNPVVVRRILKSLERAGIVDLRAGRHGGVALRRPAAEITLEDVHKAVGGDLFALRPTGNPRCPIYRAMAGSLTPVFDAASEAVDQTFRRTKLAALLAAID
ncbi:Rrf2 family transcriptional regulator [Chelatococcus reniformis]|uniref:Transcriptional regulator n=1 Tax=Chelatococcus reniformis TaxID=1494448 RepID=A0A916XQ65_9HYPH|nr:Rrf2 family transcriptional regulator [Chelatococcus reniformis]GGC91546.1 transcriptional regulator [Chelatococcus reniformis]